MALVKAHVTLEQRLVADSEAKRELLEEIVRVSGISAINVKRYERYGIVTGMVDDSRLGSLRDIAGVRSVEIDRERYLRPAG